VKWFNGEKGYGFITPEDGGKGLPMIDTLNRGAG
jgi:hypothetical protein